MSPALELLQSPGTAAPGSLDAVLRAAPRYESDLRLVAAAIYARPDLLPRDLPARLIALLAQPALPARTASLAREVLEFLLPTPLGPVVPGAVLKLATQPDLTEELYAGLCGVLQQAASWTRDYLDPAALLTLAELDHIRPWRDRLFEVIEAALYSAGPSMEPPILESVLRLYPDHPALPYLFYRISQWRQFSAAVRAQAEALVPAFPFREEAGRRLSGEGRRVLMVHNIDDGQGDEIVRTVPLLGAFLDFNPLLEAVVLTRRPYLRAHPRISAVLITDRAAVDEVLLQAFDVVIDFFEPLVLEMAHDASLESCLQDYVRTRRPFVFASSLKGCDRLVFEQVLMDGQPVAEARGLDQPRAESIYEATSRLIAELGLPLRLGVDRPVSGFVLAGVEWPDARAAWRVLVDRNTAGRPVALFNPFGGNDRLKGYVEQTFDAAAAEIGRLVGEGYFVVLIPNGTPWGSAAAAAALADCVPPECRAHLAIAEDPAASDQLHEHPPGSPLRRADYVMRQFLYFAHYASLVVTVEGWLMHAAWCLGKPYRVLMAPYSQGARWFPHARSVCQAAERDPSPSGRLDPSAPAPLVELPRKLVLRFLVRECGQSGDPAALPLLRKVLASPDHDLRRAAAEALANFRETDAAEWVPLLSDRWNVVRGVAARALLQRVDPLPVPQAEILGHLFVGQAPSDWNSLAALGEAALPALQAALEDDDPVTRREARYTSKVVHARMAFHQIVRERAPVRGRLSEVLRLLFTPRRHLVPPPPTHAGTVLILTPLKDAARLFDAYCERLRRLTYPHRAISLGFLESDSQDATFRLVSGRLRRLRREFRRAGLWKKDFGFRFPPGMRRWADPLQARRRAILARSRNHLLLHALDDEEWVLWLDADVVEYPPDIIERLLAAGKDLVQPHCVLEYGGPTFDTNAWSDHGRLHLDDLRSHGDLVDLDAVGGTMLLVRADLHRDGLIFPPFPYGRSNPRIRPDRPGEVETEGLGILAHDMGHRCWGMPHLEIRHPRS